MVKTPISVLIADDHSLILEGLVKQLESKPGLKVIGQANNGTKAWELFQMIFPEVVIFDIEMPGMDGIELTKKIKSNYPHTKVLLLTMHSEPWIIAKAKKALADGILLKNLETGEILRAVETIASGGSYFSPEINHLIKEGNKLNPDVLNLTNRELEVLKLISKGYNTSEIAENIGVSVNTLESYRKRLLSKFDACNVACLVQKAMEMKII